MKNKDSFGKAAEQYSLGTSKDGEQKGLRESGPGYAIKRRTGATNFLPDQIPMHQEYHTVADYMALPDERKAELIDGVFYDMSAPTIPHQNMAGEIFVSLKNFLKGKHGSCKAFISPVDVLLDDDDYTVVQPDVFVVCDPEKITYTRITGAPDFVAEVLSPGTKSKDMTIKFRKYKHAGVREYWMIDSALRNVMKVVFDEEDQERTGNSEIGVENIRMQVYPFEIPVPVSIFKEELQINFAAMEEETFAEENIGY